MLLTSRVLVGWHLKTKKSAELMHLSCCLGMYEHHETAVEKNSWLDIPRFSHSLLKFGGKISNNNCYKYLICLQHKRSVSQTVRYFGRSTARSTADDRAPAVDSAVRVDRAWQTKRCSDVGRVGVGGKMKFGLEKILLASQRIIELGLILGIRSETPCSDRD